MNFNLAILNILAGSPERRVPLDEVRREIEIAIESGDQGEQLQRFAEVDDIDIFQSGLVLRDDVGLRITDAGLLLLHSLAHSSGPSLLDSSAQGSPSFRSIDDLIGTEERLKIFDLELRSLEPTDDHQSPSGRLGFIRFFAY